MKPPAFGFTLIELLIVIAIVGVLSAIAIPSFSDFTTSQRLSQAAKQVKQDLRSAQNRAINGIDGMAWGIRFSHPDTHSYRIYICTSLDIDVGAGTCTCNDYTEGTTKSLADDFAFDVSAGDRFVFEEVSGNVCNQSGPLTAGDSSIGVSLSGSSRTITVSAGGKIEEN